MRSYCSLLTTVFTVILIGCVPQATSNPTVAGQTVKPRTVVAMQPLLSKALTPQVAEQIFGKPDEITGSGLLIYVYDLTNGRKLRLGFSGQPLFYAKVQNNDGSIQDLPLQ